MKKILSLGVIALVFAYLSNEQSITQFKTQEFYSRIYSVASKASGIEFSKKTIKGGLS